MRRALGAAAALALLLPAAATAAVTDRTQIASPGATAASADPSVSGDGAVVAFDTAAALPGIPDGNGAVRDVVRRSLATGALALLSQAPDGSPADGPSRDPSVSADGRRVAFVSDATNLVPGDVNGRADVFLAVDGQPLRLVSGAADGSASEPDLDASGRYVAFTSDATTLVPDDTNGKPDVFLFDADTGAISRVSLTAAGGQATGRSSAPAISRNGGSVAFESGAADLVPDDTNGVSDVFVRDRAHNTTERVSVSSRGRQQDKAVSPPFRTRPDISDDGRYVVWDSEASTLTQADTNRHADVFLRDRARGTTALISASSLDVQGNNDSVSPRISGAGRHVAFASFASNLAAGDPRREDVFVRDLKEQTTTLAAVSSTGAPRGAERVPQLLQRPALSASGRLVAFTTTADGLVDGDANGVEDVFLRRLDAVTPAFARRPTATAPELVVRAPGLTTPRPTCRLDGGRPFPCALRLDVAKLGAPGALLEMEVGGLGVMPAPLALRLPGSRALPTVRIGALRGPLRALRGTARGAARVDVGIVQFRGGGCVQLRGGGFLRTGCKRSLLSRATGTGAWRKRLPGAVTGAVLVYAQATDYAGRKGPIAYRSATLG